MNKHLSRKQVILIIIGIVSFVAFLIAITPDSQEVSNKSVSIGKEAILHNNQDLSDCTGIISVAVDREAFNELAQAATSGDMYGYEQVFTQNKAFTVENCTKVLVLERNLTSTKVRISEKQHLVGLVPYEWVKAI